MLSFLDALAADARHRTAMQAATGLLAGTGAALPVHGLILYRDAYGLALVYVHPLAHDEGGDVSPDVYFAMIAAGGDFTRLIARRTGLLLPVRLDCVSVVFDAHGRVEHVHHERGAF